MSHPSLQELTQAIHGLAPVPDHVALCADCQETVDRLRGERDLLRRADARLAAPVRARRPGAPHLLALAAAALVGITGVIVFRGAPPPVASPVAGAPQTPDMEKLVAQFLDGTDRESAQARELLVESPRSALPALVETRHQRAASLRPDAHSALILELKQKIAGPSADDLFRRMTKASLQMDFKNTPLSRVFGFITELTGLGFTTDPDLDVENIAVTLKVTGTPLIQALDLLSMLYNLEFDFRFGVLFVARPYRLFQLPGNRGNPGSTIPAQGHWRRQELSPAGAEILKKLDKARTDLAFAETPLGDVIAFIRDLAGVNIVLERDWSARVITLQAKGMPAATFLELLLLPRKWDLRIEGNTVVVFERN
jgi:hypothetical protein